jgi:hypothetical protein
MLHNIQNSVLFKNLVRKYDVSRAQVCDGPPVFYSSQYLSRGEASK